MKLTALVVACLAAVALAGPVPQNQYIIRRPQNSVNLHNAARQLGSTGQTFAVKLDDDDFDSEERLQSLQGVGRFATAQVAAPGARTAQNVNVAGTGQFRVEVDDDGEIDIDSRESDEAFFFSSTPCPAGQLRHGNRCVIPKINRNIFVFGREDEPEPESKSIDPAQVPLPQLDYNIIFVRSRPSKTRRPLVVPPPQKKTVVYVLEDESAEDDNVIEAPAFPDADPEVYYVKVKDGENPQLPGGLDLETAYSQAIRPLQSDDSFESSLELTLGPGGAPGPAPLPTGGAPFSSPIDSVGVPLSATQPQATFNGAGLNGAGLNDGGLNGGGAGFGAPQNVGVPLPSFQGSADFGAQGSLGRSASAAQDQAFAGSTQLSAGARNFEVEIDDGRVEIEPASKEVVRPALRYRVPQLG